MNNDFLYEERVTSNKTGAFFIGLTLLFMGLLVWRAVAGGFDWLAATFLIFAIFFLFYVVNYRTLIIRITPEALTLTFGIFSWTVPLDNIADCRLDELPPLMRLGGAGIHFMMIRHRYRASFNFLEYPRVAIGFKRKVGPVQDISFSTCQPEQVIRVIKEAIAKAENNG